MGLRRRIARFWHAWRPGCTTLALQRAGKVAFSCADRRLSAVQSKGEHNISYYLDRRVMCNTTSTKRMHLCQVYQGFCRETFLVIDLGVTCRELERAAAEEHVPGDMASCQCLSAGDRAAMAQCGSQQTECYPNSGFHHYTGPPRSS